MSFWRGVAQAYREEDQQRHEQELFQQKVLEKRKENILDGLMQRRAAQKEQQAELMALIEKGEKIFNGDTDVVAALYDSGQLTDLVGLYEKRFESEDGLDPSYFNRVASVVRSEMGDDIEGMGNRLITALNSDAQSYEEFMAVAASGNIEDLPEDRASALSSFRSTVDTPTFGIPGTGQSSAQGSGDYSSAQKAVATAVGPLLGFNVSKDQNTGEIMVNFNTDSDFITEDQAQMALNAATRVFYNRGDMGEDQALQYIEDTIGSGKTQGSSWEGIKESLDNTASQLRVSTNPESVLYSPTPQPTVPQQAPVQSGQEYTFGGNVPQGGVQYQPVQPTAPVPSAAQTPSQRGPANTEYEAMETLGSGTNEEEDSETKPSSIGAIFDSIFGM